MAQTIMRVYTHASLGMAIAVRTHATPIHAACGGGAPSGLKEGARVVGIAATAFAVTQTPIVCTSVSKYGRPSASCGRPCAHEVVHVVGTPMCTPPDSGVPRAPFAAAPRAQPQRPRASNPCAASSAFFRPAARYLGAPIVPREDPTVEREYQIVPPRVPREYPIVPTPAVRDGPHGSTAAARLE